MELVKSLSVLNMFEGKTYRRVGGWGLKGEIKRGHEDPHQGFWMHELGRRALPLSRRQAVSGRLILATGNLVLVTVNLRHFQGSRGKFWRVPDWE